VFPGYSWNSYHLKNLPKVCIFYEFVVIAKPAEIASDIPDCSATGAHAADDTACRLLDSTTNAPFVRCRLSAAGSELKGGSREQQVVPFLSRLVLDFGLTATTQLFERRPKRLRPILLRRDPAATAHGSGSPRGEGSEFDE